MKRFVILDTIFGAAIGVQLGGELAVSVTWAKKKLHFGEVEVSYQEGMLATVIGYGRELLVWFSSDRPDVGTIAHEAFHVTHHTFSILDIPLDESTKEVWAYYTEMVVRQINKRARAI